MEALTAEDGHEDPDMRALIARASAAANFMRMLSIGLEPGPLIGVQSGPLWPASQDLVLRR